MRSSLLRNGNLRLWNTHENDNVALYLSENNTIDQIDSKIVTQRYEDDQQELITNRNLRFSGVGR